MAKKQWFKWKVEFQVARIWVEDGFDMTDERALNMLSGELGFANIQSELRAKVILRPTDKQIQETQS